MPTTTNQSEIKEKRALSLKFHSVQDYPNRKRRVRIAQMGRQARMSQREME
jgi:hypothetical protein